MRLGALPVKSHNKWDRIIIAVGCLGVALLPPAPVQAQDLGPLLVGVALPGILLGTVCSVVLKFGLLSLPRYREARPRASRFLGIALVDFTIWALAFPASLALRFGDHWVYEKYLPVVLIPAICFGYLVNHLAFQQATSPRPGAVSLTSVALVLLFSLLLPLLILVFALASLRMVS